VWGGGATASVRLAGTPITVAAPGGDSSSEALGIVVATERWRHDERGDRLLPGLEPPTERAAVSPGRTHASATIFRNTARSSLSLSRTSATVGGALRVRKRGPSPNLQGGCVLLRNEPFWVHSETEYYYVNTKGRTDFPHYPP
jgi:hypothetical protein